MVQPSYDCRIWKLFNLKPHSVKTFKLSATKLFEKLIDVVGLYLNPLDKSLVLFVDENSQIQALDRTQLGLPLSGAMLKGKRLWRIGT